MSDLSAKALKQYKKRLSYQRSYQRRYYHTNRAAILAKRKAARKK